MLHPEKSAQQVDYANALETYRVNVLGPLLLMKHFSGFLPRKATTMDLGGTKLPQHAVWVDVSSKLPPFLSCCGYSRVFWMSWAWESAAETFRCLKMTFGRNILTDVYNRPAQE